MKVLIIGGGGREHAIAKKVSMSPRVSKLYCAPGNAGIAECAQCIDIAVMDFHALADFAVKEEIDLTIVGPDDPLVAGVVDVLEERGLRVFGPRKKAAAIEGSKVFSKDLMKKYQIPTAGYEAFDTSGEALAYLKTSRYPIVLKADGLALGKGVLICNNYEEAAAGVQSIMEDKQFGSAGDRMVIEEFITGPEVSVLAFCDGTHIKPMTSAQDHKRAKDGDQGLNTGGMGTFSPSPFYTREIDDYCKKYIYQPTIDAMKAEGRDFIGILFVGLMLTPEGPKVLEYNARFGDPEAQVVLPRMKNDLIDVVEACIDHRLDSIDLRFEDNAAVCVVLASDGYPEYYDKGFPITGIENFHEKDDYFLFHAGTKKSGEAIVTNGGRVLGVTAKGRDLKEARKKAYEATGWIHFDNKYMRNDIGKAIDEAL
ncbi:phosphoribosylamine--glycine ligase [Mobilitalea sibirica]|uniref:Phosphoribosylamine--glycine ligase n=1 Tax=Mobilitalea sibirica TaxID=1462919 RepID=A0A8J7KRH4_9FIRM|nr:phosphoribosylamine--glycine ligase [Mobilitalea sibirica]MBH1939291.1 phosphoribosylamine--glycine ligase [Mobilitalea sibirica]